MDMNERMYDWLIVYMYDENAYNRPTGFARCLSNTTGICDGVNDHLLINLGNQLDGNCVKMGRYNYHNSIIATFAV